MSNYTNSFIDLVKRLLNLNQTILILDASFVIAMCEQMDYPKFIDKLLALNYKLVIPSLVWEKELKRNPAHDIILKYIKEHKIEIICLNTMDDIVESRESLYDIEPGEIDVISTYFKLIERDIKVCCGLDDKKARKVAIDLGINIKGVVGLLLELKKEKLLSSQEVNKIGISLVKNDFRLSRYLKTLLAAN